MSTNTFPSGYARDKTVYTVRDMTLEEVKDLRSGDHIQVLTYQQNVLTVRVNGAPKTWKTRPGNVRVPYKYGMYEFGYIEFAGGMHVGGPTPVVSVHA